MIVDAFEVSISLFFSGVYHDPAAQASLELLGLIDRPTAADGPHYSQLGFLFLQSVLVLCIFVLGYFFSFFPLGA